MRISVDSPYGLNGSIHIEGLYVYVSETKFDVDSLPTPYMNNTVSYSGYNIEFPIKDKPYWVMWAYRGKDNQKAYSPCIRLVDWSDKMTTMFNNNPGFSYGDADAGYLNSNLNTADRVDSRTFDSAHGLNIGWNTVGIYPNWFMVDGKIIGCNATVNKLMVTAGTLYRAGYFAKSGDLTDVYSAQTITLLGGAKEQGLDAITPNAQYYTWVPTLDEFKLYLGGIFQCGIESTLRPISPWVMTSDMWFMTSTQSSTGKFWAINNKGETKEIGHAESVAVLMLFDFTLR